MVIAFHSCVLAVLAITVFRILTFGYPCHAAKVFGVPGWLVIGTMSLGHLFLLVCLTRWHLSQELRAEGAKSTQIAHAACAGFFSACVFFFGFRLLWEGASAAVVPEDAYLDSFRLLCLVACWCFPVMGERLRQGSWWDSARLSVLSVTVFLTGCFLLSFWL